MDKHFPSSVHRTPEFLVGNAECTDIPPEAKIDSHGAREKNACRGECCEFGRELLQLSAHVLACGVLCEGGRCWLRQQGCKEMVDALGVEEGGKLGENLWCNAQRDNGDQDRLASRLGHGGSRGLKNREIRTVRRENNVVRREERDPAFDDSGDLTRIDRQHMGRDVGREVVDDHR